VVRNIERRLGITEIITVTAREEGDPMSAMSEAIQPIERSAVADDSRAGRKRIVIIRGGFAGLAAAHAMRHADADLVLIDRHNHHVFQPLLY
jgi:NADH dehydrogenase